MPSLSSPFLSVVLALTADHPLPTNVDYETGDWGNQTLIMIFLHYHLIWQPTTASCILGLPGTHVR